MSIIDGLRSPEAPAGSEDLDALRILVAVESRADAERASRRLRQLDASYRCSVTLLGVARCSLFAQCFAPLSGLTTPAELSLHATESAGRLAVAAAAETNLPGIDHVGAVGSWKSMCIVEPLRYGVYDTLVIGSLPRRRFARRRLLAAARASGTTVLVGDE